jgi:hypothetical protein
VLEQKNGNIVAVKVKSSSVWCIPFGVLFGEEK